VAYSASRTLILFIEELDHHCRVVNKFLGWKLAVNLIDVVKRLWIKDLCRTENSSLNDFAKDAIESSDLEIFLRSWSVEEIFQVFFMFKQDRFLLFFPILQLSLTHKCCSSLSLDLPWDERLKELCHTIKFVMLKKALSPDLAAEKPTQETRNVLLDLIRYFRLHLHLDDCSVAGSLDKRQARQYLPDVWSLRWVFMNHTLGQN
jgi:hypothetical protein